MGSNVQTKSAYDNSSGNPLTLVLTSALTSGNTLAVAVINADTSVTISSIVCGSDTLNNLGTLSTGAGRITLFEKRNCTGGSATITITLSAASPRVNLIAHEISGVDSVRDSAMALDSGSGTDIDNVSINGQSGDFVVAFVSDDNPNNNGGQYTAGTGAVQREQNLASGFYCSEDYAAGGISSATFSNSFSAVAYVGAISFYQSSGGPTFILMGDGLT